MKWKGSVTVFSALSLMLIASFLFALLELGRVHMLEAYADMTSELALESVCAEYQPTLWEDYRLLCLDGAYGGGAFSMEHVDGVLRQRIDRNINTEGLRGNLLAMKLKTVEVKDYQLLTDGEGRVFLHRIAACMKENFPREAAARIYEEYTKGKEIEQESPMEESIENAQKAIVEARENQKKKMGTSNEEEAKENPLEIALALKENAVLGLVLGGQETVSARQINLSDSLQKRALCAGLGGVNTEVDWYEKVLVLEYLDQYYADYTSPAEKHALSYEMEYVLCGKETDRANLEDVVNRLLLMREAANVVHIVGDGTKREETLALASALAGFSGNPAIIKVVQAGIIAAWAYMESILDVRALLQGDKIALMKNKEQWTIQVSNLLESFQTNAKAKSCENGCSYQSYLKLLLFCRSEKLLAYRMMDVMEQNIRLIPAQRNCRMDHMICRMTYQMGYQSKTLFLKSHVLENRKMKQFSYY